MVLGDLDSYMQINETQPSKYTYFLIIAPKLFNFQKSFDYSKSILIQYLGGLVHYFTITVFFHV